MLRKLFYNINFIQVIIFILLIIILSLSVIIFFKFTVDDAFIGFRYAENFANGHGLVFNSGEKVEGYSNFLWVFMLGILKILKFDVIIASKVLGLLSLIVLIIICYKLSLEITKDWIYFAGVFCLLSTNFSIVFFSVTGMETIFFASLLTLSGYIFYRNKYKVSLGLSILSLIIALTRPEGIIYFPILLCFDLLRNRSISRRLVTSMALFLGAYIAFLLWRYNYYGYFVPNTFYAKPPKISQDMPIIISSFDDIYRFVLFTGGPLFACLVIFSLLNRETRNKIKFLLPILLMIIAFQIYSGGDWMGHYRYLVPMLPAYFLIGVCGVWWIFRKLNNNKRVHIIFLLVFLFFGLINLGESLNFYKNRNEYPNFVMTSEYLITAAKWIGERYPENYTITCWRIGALAYYSHLNLIDVGWGLTDKYIAKKRPRGQWNDKEIEKYIIKRNPELIMNSVQRVFKLKETIKKGDKIYSLVKVFEQGSHEWWVLYERNDLSVNYENNI